MKRLYPLRWLSVLCILMVASPGHTQSLDDLGDLFEDSPPQQPAEEAPPAQPELYDPFAQPSDQPAEGEGLSRQEQIEQAMNQAQALVAEEKWADAVAIYSQLIAAEPAFAPPYFERAKCFVELKEYDLALSSFQYALDYGQIDPVFAAAVQLERSKLYMLLQNFEEALADISAVITSQPGNAEPMFLRGKALYRSGQLAASQQAFDAQQGLGAIQQSITSFNRAIELDPDYADAFAERAAAQTMLQQFDKAVEDIQKAVELDDANPNYLARLGSILSQRAATEQSQYNADREQMIADFRAAIESYDRYLEIEQGKMPEDYLDAPPDTVTPDRVLSEKATAEIELAAELDGAEREALLRQVLDDTEAAIVYDDRGWIPLYQRGIAYRLLGQFEDAVRAFTDALDVAPVAEIHMRRGIARFHLGEWQMARRDFEVASQQSQAGGDPRAAFWIGATFAEEGDWYQAVRHYTDALRMNPEYKPAYNNRGLAYLQLGLYSRAARDFNELVRRDHDDDIARKRRDMALRLAETGRRQP